MANLELEGLELAGRAENPEAARIFGKSRAAVQLRFEVLEGFDGEQLVLEAVEVAESTGWEFDDDQPVSIGTWRGTKTLETGRAQVSIGFSESFGYLVVILDYEVLFD